MPSDAPDLSIVVPAYNEAERIGPSIGAIRRFCAARPESWELIIVNDGSKDATAETVRREAASDARIRLISFDQNRGKGHAVREGVLASRGARVLITDADLASPIGEADRLSERLRAGFDGAIGVRVSGAGVSRVERSFLRTATSRAFNWAVCLLVLKGFTDTQCGFKMFRGDAIRAVFRRQVLDGFSFDIEMLYLTRKAGLNITEVPVAWKAQPGSKVRLLRDSAAMLADALKIRRIHG